MERKKQLSDEKFIGSYAKLSFGKVLEDFRVDFDHGLF